tara:strand:- start:69 stop:293 length:225 start_codon:yes stop_codon:yes gene_type:complete|eukprot:COSAG06_NODE_2086_length_7632_cov_22.212133_10_plen_75_part_00
MEMIELSTDQIERLKVLFPKIRSGVAQDRNARIEMVVLHNDIFGSNYRPDTGCSSCLNTSFQGIKKVAKKYNIK